MDGDVNPKKDIKNKIKIDENGFVWNLVIFFPFDFSVKNGLITKSDFFDLTKNIMPPLITDMGLKIDNTIWYSALHRNTKNPHMHILIYEKKKTATSGFINQSAIKNMKRNIVNYLIDNTKFYELRDREFSNITGAINLKDLAKVKTQKLYSDSYRKGLNTRLLSPYSKLPPKGRLQYNSKNMIPYKEELNNVIEYILMHDSVKYNYDADSIISLASSFKTDMTSSEYFNALKRLGYNYENIVNIEVSFFIKILIIRFL